MKCPKCGVEIMEGAAFCTSCGAEMSVPDEEKSNEVPFPSEDGKPRQPDGAGEVKTETTAEKAVADAPVKENKAGGSRAPYFITACVGVFVAIVGLMALTYSGKTIFETSFGGDAYTYIYKGVFAIWEQMVQIVRCVGAITFGAGVTMTCTSIAKLGGSKE